MSHGQKHHRRRPFRIMCVLGLGVCLVLVLYVMYARDRESGSISVVPQSSSPAVNQTPEDFPAIQFSDVTSTAGIRFTHFAGAMGAKWYPETIGAGVGFFDYDGDAWPDILFVNGTHWPDGQGPARGQTAPTMRLYRNRGDGTFADVTERAGVAIPVYGMGLAVADYDNDGDRDFLVTGYLHNLFFINNGDGTFSEAAQRLGIQNGKWGSGAAFFDYDRDGYVDLVISNYVEWAPALERDLDCTYGTLAKDYCPVRYFKGQGLILYRNRGDGTFEDVTRRAGVASEGTRAFAPYIFDFNEDRWPDIFVTSDGTPSLLYRNRGDGTFEEVGVQSGIVLDERGAAYAGMGIDATYPRNDGQLCIAIGNFVGEPTTLHCRVRQEASYHPELYAEVSSWAGIGRPTLRYVTFGLFFFDADLDGFEDLFMVNGHVVDEARLRNAPQAQRPQLFRNLGNGKFQEIVPPPGSGLDTAWVGRGAAYADYDGDGDLDMVVSQNQGSAILLRNDTQRRTHYLRLHLQGTTSNRDGIGAIIRIHTADGVRRQMVRSGRSYYSQNELPLTFGLGQTAKIDRVAIHWPSGIVDVYREVPANTTLHAVEGEQAEPSPAPQRAAVPVMTEKDRLPGGLPTASASNAFLAQTQAGIAAYDAERYMEATEAFARAVRLNASDPLPYRYLAALYWRLGKREQAAQTVHALAGVMPDAYFLDRVGNAFEETELLGLAMLFYKEAVRIDPQFPSARYNLGRGHLEQGDLDQGLAEVQEALRLYPDFAEAHQAIGMAYTEQGRFDEAIGHLQRALAIRPDLTTAQNHLGRLYMAQGRFDEAVQTFETLVARSPHLAEARHNLAVAYARSGRQEQAVKQFKEAVRQQPDFHAASVDLATLLLEMRHSQEAIKVLQAVLSTALKGVGRADDVDLVDVRYRLGIAYLAAGKISQAVRELEVVILERPSHAAAHVHLGTIYYRTRQFERAWKHARRAQALGASVTELLTALGRVSMEPH